MVDLDSIPMDGTVWVTVSDDSMMSALVSHLSDVAVFQLKEFNSALKKTNPGAKLARLFSKAERKDVDSVTLDQMLRHQLAPLPAPLLKAAGDELYNKAIKAFSIILRFSEYPALTSDTSIELGQEILKMALGSVELRDECYMQLFKQSRGNGNVGSRNEVWKLTHLLAATAPPSKEFVSLLTHYIHEVANSVTENIEVRKSAQRTGYALAKSVRAGARRVVPTIEEIKSLISEQPCYVDIYFLDDTVESVPYYANTTVLEAVEKLSGIVGLESYHTFSLYECRERTELGEQFLILDDHRYLADIIQDIDEDNDDHRLVFRKRMFRETDADNRESQFLTLSYIQVQYDYLQGYYPVVYEDAAQLCALQLIPEFKGELPGEERAIDKAIKMYSNGNFRRGRAQWRSDVVNKFLAIQPLSIDMAHYAFLSLIRSLPYGDSVFFGVKRWDDPIGLLPPKVIIGVNRRGVHFFRPIPKEYLHSVELRDIMQFGSSDRAVFFKMRVAGVLHIFQFESKQGDEICMAVQTHINDLMVKRYAEAPMTGSRQTSRNLIVEQTNGRSNEMDKETDELSIKQTSLLELHDKHKQSRARDRALLQETVRRTEHVAEKKQHEENELDRLQLEITRLKAELRELKRTNSAESTHVGQLVRYFDDQTKSELRAEKEREKALRFDIATYRKHNALLKTTLDQFEDERQKEIGALNEAIFDTESDCRGRLHLQERRLESLQHDVSRSRDNLYQAASELRRLQEDSTELIELKMLQTEVEERDAIHAATIDRQRQRINQLEKDYKNEQLLRKSLYNQIEVMKGSIRVYARVRSINSREQTRGSAFILDFPDRLTISHPWKREEGCREYSFDHVFLPSATQADVFTDTRDLIQSAVDGYNVCIFAYGQTGSGKTYTIYGHEKQPGLAPRAINHLFTTINRLSDRTRFRVRCYMMELYQDVLVDVLASRGGLSTESAAGDTKRLEIKRDHASNSVRVEGVTVIEVHSARELMHAFEEGQRRRHVSATKVNFVSSRSHLIMSILIDSTDLQTQIHTRGKLSFVDLAGSERVKKSQSTGEQLKEAQAINKSLSALGDVILALVRGDAHVPYRNHKLTMLMSDSLGGNAKALMFVNVSPTNADLDETQNSLQYAKRVRTIKNGISKESDQEIAALKKRLAFWKAIAMGGDEGSAEVDNILREFR